MNRRGHNISRRLTIERRSDYKLTNYLEAAPAGYLRPVHTYYPQLGTQRLWVTVSHVPNKRSTGGWRNVDKISRLDTGPTNPARDARSLIGLKHSTTPYSSTSSRRALGYHSQLIPRKHTLFNEVRSYQNGLAESEPNYFVSCTMPAVACELPICKHHER